MKVILGKTYASNSIVKRLPTLDSTGVTGGSSARLLASPNRVPPSASIAPVSPKLAHPYRLASPPEHILVSSPGIRRIPRGCSNGSENGWGGGGDGVGDW